MQKKERYFLYYRYYKSHEEHKEHMNVVTKERRKPQIANCADQNNRKT